MFDSHGKTLKSYLDLINQNRNGDLKGPAEFNGDWRSFLHAKYEQAHTEIQYHESSKLFRTKPQFLKLHQKHKILKAHECTECGKPSSRSHSSWNVREFIQERNSMDITYVGKPSSRSVSSLTENQEIHNGEKPHAYSGCGVVFLRKFQLTEHQETHAGNKPHVCSMCGKTSSRKFKLTECQRTYTRRKLYKFTKCGKAFCRKVELITHQKQKRRKPHGCSECQKGFRRKSQLILHEETHIGEKPYMCMNVEKGNLIIHQPTPTGKRPYGCTEGGKVFSQKACLKGHQ